jgi:hypothetical protein
MRIPILTFCPLLSQRLVEVFDLRRFYENQSWPYDHLAQQLVGYNKPPLNYLISADVRNGCYREANEKLASLAV